MIGEPQRQAGGQQPQQGYGCLRVFSWLFPKEANIFFAFTFGLLNLFSIWLAAFFVTFLRYKFGVRFYHLGFFIAAFGGWGISFSFLPLAFPEMYTEETTRLFFYSGVAFFILGLVHIVWAFTRNRQKDNVHSLFFGRSLLSVPNFFPFSHNWHMYLLIEPAMLFATAYAFYYQFDELSGIFMSLGAAALTYQNYYFFFMERRRIHDILDSRVETDYYNQKTPDENDNKHDEIHTASPDRNRRLLPSFRRSPKKQKTTPPASDEDIQNTVDDVLGSD